MSDTHIGPSELATMLDVPEQTVYGWNSKGTGPRFAKVGRHVRYRRSDVEAWLDSHSSRLAA
jgi:excisionase family DNA binding protein